MSTFDSSSQVRKGLLWHQRDKLFSRCNDHDDNIDNEYDNDFDCHHDGDDDGDDGKCDEKTRR